MKQSRKAVLFILTAIFILSLFPAGCLAVYKVQPLKTNQWYSLQDSSGDMPVYKIKVSSDTVLIVEWRKYKTDGNFAYGSICADRACNNEVASFLGISVPGSGTTGCVLYPGTYYIRMYDGNEKAQVRINKKPAKSVNRQNNCVGKAIGLSKNKKAEFAQSRNDNYTRWYKIRLTKEQPISIYGYDSWYELYDSNFNEIRCTADYENGVITTDGIQSKGTYYLALHDYISSLLRAGKYCRIYWK